MTAVETAGGTTNVKTQPETVGIIMGSRLPLYDNYNDRSIMDAPTYSFRIRASRADNSATVTAVLNAVNAANGSTVVVCGSMEDAAYDALVAQYATDNGTTALRFDIPAPKIKSAVDYRAKTLKRRLLFNALEVHNGEDWVTVAYAIRPR